MYFICPVNLFKNWFIGQENKPPNLYNHLKLIDTYIDFIIIIFSMVK